MAAEGIGLALSVAGVAGLFKSCIDCFNMVQMGRARNGDYRILHQKLDNQKARFIAWGQSLDLHISRAAVDSHDTLHITSAAKALAEIIGKNVKLIIALFQESDKLQSHYGLARHACTELELAKTGNEVSPLRHMFQRLQSISGTTATSSGSRSSTFRWVIEDRERFVSLVTDLRELIDDVESLTCSAELVARRRKIISHEFEEMSESELMLIEAADVGSPDMIVEAARFRLGSPRDRSQDISDEGMAILRELHLLRTSLGPSRLSIAGTTADEIDISADIRERFSVADAKSRVAHTTPEEKLAQMSKWFDAVDTDRICRDALNARVSGSCNWIFQTRPFIEWMRREPLQKSSSKALWIHGPAGFGKSVVCASMVQHIAQTDMSCVASFFCAAEEEKTRAAPAILRSWLYQLAQQNESALEASWKIFQKRSMLKATDSELWKIFEEVGQQDRNLFFVVDGLDECDKKVPNSKLHAADLRVSFLRRLLESTSRCSVRLLLVSRYISEIHSLWNYDNTNYACNQFFQYEISQTDTVGDVEIFSSSVLNEQLPKRSELFKEELLHDIVEKCDGSFLQVSLLRMKLVGWKNLAQLREVISETPAALEDTYARELNNILSLDDEDRRSAIAILRWILLATKSLTVQELTEALVVQFADGGLDFPVDHLPDEYDDIYVNDRFLRICGPLVHVRKADASQSVACQTVHFTHFSVKEYLVRTMVGDDSMYHGKLFENERSENSLLAQICIRYLMRTELSEDNTSPEWLKEALIKYAFFAYAASSWFVHVSKGRESSHTLKDVLRQFFDPGISRHSIWSFKFEHESSTALPSNLYYAALFGLAETIQYLLSQNIAINAAGGKYGSALQAAAVQGHLRAVELLLENGAIVDIEGSEFSSCVVAAASNPSGTESTNIVKALIGKSSTVSGTDMLGNTALHLAAKHGNKDLVALLLEHGAEKDVTSQKSNTPLHEAAIEGMMEVVQLLLDHGADLETRGYLDYRALHQASFHGHEAIVRMLLKRGAFVNACAKANMTALHLAAFQSRVGVASVLLGYEPDVHARAYNGATPLHMASIDPKNASMVELLVDHSADPCLTTDDGSTILHTAAIFGSGKVLPIFKSRGGDVDARTTRGDTPLHVAATHGKHSFIELLLQEGANVDAKNHDGRTALFAASEAGYVEVVKLLLAWTAEVNTKSVGSSTALYSAVLHKHVEVAGVLLKAGADVLNADDRGFTALHAAAENSSESTLALLLQYRADVASISLTPLSITALGVAAVFGNVGSAKLLVDAGSDINTALHEGQTALHIAVSNGRLGVAKLLLERGAHLEARDRDGFTALHLAAVGGSTAMLDSLLEKGADVGAITDSGLKAVELASLHGHEDVLRTLVERETDPNIKVKDCSKALRLAAENGHDKNLAMLLEAGADVHGDPRGDHSTSVHIAAQKGHEKTVEFLLNHGANIESRMNDNRTALHVAARNGHTSVAKLLLSCKADKEAKTDILWTPLHSAIAAGHDGIFQLLIENGSDRKATDKAGFAPLHFAAFYGRLNVVTVLLGVGSDADIQAEDGTTPLHLAAIAGHVSIVTALLHAGASVKAVDEKGSTPLHLAGHVGNEDIIRLLCANRADPEALDKWGSPALHYAARGGHLGATRGLLQLGADVKARSRYDVTALHVAASLGHKLIVELLLGEGADPSDQTWFCTTALHQAIFGGWVDIVDPILSAQPNLFLQDIYGRNCVDWAFIHQPNFGMVLQNCGEYTLTDEAVRLQTLRESVLRFLEKLRSFPEENLYSELGRCLIFLGESADAQVCFEQQITTEKQNPTQINSVCCSGCNDKELISGNRFVCQTCADVDLCTSCKAQYDAGVPVRTCDGHSFFQIPGPGWASLAQDTINDKGESKQHWLDRLSTEYQKLAMTSAHPSRETVA